MSQFSIFDSERQLEKIHQLLPSETQIAYQFRDVPSRQARPPKPQPNGGRPPYDNVLLAKVLILKYLYQLSGEDTELQIRDRLSFHDFLDLTNSDHFPDARWTKKNNEVHYGYKDHVQQDVEHKFIRDYSVTSSSFMLEGLS